MAKGGSPMGGGGFGGQQQQQGGFGGGFGGQQQQQQQGYGGGFGGQMPQQQQQGGFGGGFQPSRQRFNPMPQQQGFGNTFARTMPPQQQPQQQGFGGGIGSFLGGQGFNMPQQMRNPMRPMVSQMAPEQDFGQSQLAAQDAAMRSLGMPTSNEVDYTDPRRGMGINVAQPPRQQPQGQVNQPPATPSQLYDMLRGMGGGSQPVVAQPGGNLLGGAFLGGGSQPVLGQPGGNLVGGMDPRVLRPNVNRLPSQQTQMPGNPYSQQIRQEDPRMQAMRNMQRMNFGGGGGYNF